MHTVICKICNSDNIRVSSLSHFNAKTGKWQHEVNLGDYYCRDCEKETQIILKASIHKCYLNFNDDLFYNVISKMNLNSCNVGGKGQFPTLLDLIIDQLPGLIENEGYHRISISGSDPFWLNFINNINEATEEIKKRLEPIVKAVRFDQAISGKIP